MYVAPLNIIYKDGEYIYGVNIKTEDVYARLEEEVPSTSLPTPATIQKIFNQIKSDDYNKVLAVTISSVKSNTRKMLAEQENGIFSIVSKTIEENRSLNKVLKLATDYIGDTKRYNLAVLHAAAEEKAEDISASIKSSLPNSNIFIKDQISPALCVYTDPGGIGIVFQKL